MVFSEVKFLNKIYLKCSTICYSFVNNWHWRIGVALYICLHFMLTYVVDYELKRVSNHLLYFSLEASIGFFHQLGVDWAKKLWLDLTCDAYFEKPARYWKWSFHFQTGNFSEFYKNNIFLPFISLKIIPPNVGSIWSIFLGRAD